MRAFSLVELSIVLVILGLLTGGILAGQSLIRAAELRSVTTEYNRYYSATQVFRSKYMALPGDINNATRFWGDDNTNCPDAAIANGSPGTCNGNGDGMVTGASNANLPGETFAFWQQLSLAGLIEGTYSILAGAAGGNDHIVGTNCAASRMNQAGWGMRHTLSFSGETTFFNGSYGNFLMIGKQSPGNNRPKDPFLRPEEAWGIDAKLDDGKPATGNVVSRERVNCTLTAAGAAITTAAADAAKLDATYNLPSSGTVCALVLRGLL